MVFRTVMLSIDFAFWRNKVLGWLRGKLRLHRGLEFEDELEESMKGIENIAFANSVSVEFPGILIISSDRMKRNCNRIIDIHFHQTR